MFYEEQCKIQVENQLAGLIMLFSQISHYESQILIISQRQTVWLNSSNSSV